MIGPLNLLLRLLVAWLAGLLAAQIMPPTYGPWLFLPIGIGLLYLIARGQRSRTSGFIGLVGGVGYFLPLLRWMDVVGTDAWLLLTMLCASWWWLAFSFLPRMSTLRNSAVAFARSEEHTSELQSH